MKIKTRTHDWIAVAGLALAYAAGTAHGVLLVLGFGLLAAGVTALAIATAEVTGPDASDSNKEKAI